MTTTIWDMETDKKRKRILKFELARNNAGLLFLDRAEKYKKMTASAFAFYRGAAHLFYRDLAARNLIAAARFVRAHGVPALFLYLNQR